MRARPTTRRRRPADAIAASPPVLGSVPSPASAGLTVSGAPRTILVGVDLGPGSSFDPTLDELALLAQSAGDDPVARITAKRRAPDAALFVGSGKADEIKAAVETYQAHGVIFDQTLSPAQQRNLEQHLGVSVADRTGLILDIFAARAQSHEGKLQVELARLQYQATRLVRRWTHLERQSGGIGLRGGPGEAQIELDRRMIGERIKTVKSRLEKVKRQHQTQRRARAKSGTFRVSLVGYTNAGKSTLFNALTKSRAFAADQLFATLDTTTRQLWLAEAGRPQDDGPLPSLANPLGGRPAAKWQARGRQVALSDTVGFIRDLPHKLVEAFRATLQEAADADLLLHVIDAASPLATEQIEEVERVLEEIGADRIAQILVFNKLDRIDETLRPRTLVDAVERAPGVRTPRVFVSARDGLGLDALRVLIAAEAARALNGAALPTLDSTTELEFGSTSA